MTFYRGILVLCALARQNFGGISAGYRQIYLKFGGIFCNIRRTSHHQPAKINSRLPEKIQHNSGFLDGFGALLDDPGPGGVVWVTLSGQEDSGDLFQSWAAIMETPGAEHRLPGQIVGKWFWERNFLKSSRFFIVCVSFSIRTPGTGLRML